MLVKDLDFALAIKLGDTVTSSGTDGQIFSFALRLGYLQRANAKLLRDLPKLMGKYTPLFANSYELHSEDILEGQTIVPLTKLDADGVQRSVTIEKIEELFVTVTKDSKAYYEGKASYIDHEKYLSIINDGQSAYDASFEDKHFYYTILSNKIHLVPTIKSEIGVPLTYVYTGITMTMKEELITLDLESDIPISKDYEDLLLAMASLEGMQDIAQIQKAQLYTAEIGNQLAVLKNYADVKTRKEGSDPNG